MPPRAPAAETPREGEEERLLIEAAKADPRRFGELYERHVGQVYAFVARRAGGRSEAEDLTAEVFHRALAHLGRYEWRGAPFAAWLLQIARNALADRWQRTARERGTPALPLEPADEEPADLERRAALARLVDRLPEDQRRVVRARFGEGRTIREIARELGRSEGAVKQLQFRALESLRARLGSEPDEDRR
jgi:RNA polymerase sigma-70 factor (ECF subfamily)